MLLRATARNFNDDMFLIPSGMTSILFLLMSSISSFVSRSTYPNQFPPHDIFMRCSSQRTTSGNRSRSFHRMLRYRIRSQSTI